MMAEQEYQFADMDTWKGSGQKGGLNFKQIVLMHVERCVKNGSVEWTGGYWEKKPASQGGMMIQQERYVPNTRSVFNNSVQILRALLLGYYDKKIQSKDDEIQKKLKQAHENYEDEMLEHVKTELYIQLFQELILQVKRMNFFEEEEWEGDVIE